MSVRTFKKGESKLMGSRDPRILAKQNQISEITFRKGESGQIGSRDPRIQAKQRQISVVTLKNKI